ncbi:MAG: MFS transporter [candidate division NC10 bacterium]|nr:MFS transporter [candidate division NC10 bacterium]
MGKNHDDAGVRSSLPRGGVETSAPWYHGITRYQWLVLTVASLGWAFDTMDQWLYVLARQPALRTLLGPLASDADVAYYGGIVQTCLILGWATGGVFFGMVGDRWGRTRTMAVTVLLYAGFTGLSGLTQTWQQFAACRFLTGLGVGGEFAAGASLVAEVFPERARAKALGLMQAAAAIGNMMAAVINLTIGAAPWGGWRWVFGVGVLPAFLVFIIRLMVKEPERWQHAHEIAARGQQKLGAIQDLFTSPDLRRHTLVGVSLAAVGVVGFWGIGTWSPDLLRQALNPQNLPDLKPAVERAASLSIMGQNAGAFFGILAWALLAERIGRRGAFLAAFLGCMVVVPLTFSLVTSFTHAVFLFPLMGFVTTSLFAGYTIYFPELYPTRLRATGTGFCYNVARYLAAAAPYTFGRLRAVYGIRQAATIMSTVFLLGIVTLAFAPETKDKPLPE